MSHDADVMSRISKVQYGTLVRGPFSVKATSQAEQVYEKICFSALNLLLFCVHVNFHNLNFLRNFSLKVSIYICTSDIFVT